MREGGCVRRAVGVAVRVTVGVMRPPLPALPGRAVGVGDATEMLRLQPKKSLSIGRAAFQSNLNPSEPSGSHITLTMRLSIVEVIICDGSI